VPRLEYETAVRHPDTLELIERPDPAQRLGGILERFVETRRRRRSIRRAKLLCALLAATLLGVWLLRPPRHGGDENRAATAFPTLTVAGLAVASDQRQADAALRDRLALRRYVVMAVGETARDRLRTSLNPQVVLGDDGTPFLTEDFTLPCQYDFDPGRTDAGLLALRGAGKVTGKTITVAIAPDKSTVLTDRLGRRAGALMACSTRVRRATERTWDGGPASPVLTTWSQLAAAARPDPDRIFQPGDSHWTSEGSLIWGQALIHRLVAQGEAPGSLDGAPRAFRAGDVPADGDLYRLMGISRSGTVPDWAVSRPGVKVRAKTMPSPSGRGLAVFRSQATSTTDPAPLITGRTLVVDDSFFSRAEGQLAPYFSDLQIMHWVDFLACIEQDRLPGFDRVILETVQRGWPERAGWLRPGQPVFEALRQELSTPP
jgi:hypothetical protein